MTLRIIGGKYRRRHLKTPHGKTTRPYTDRVRQIVFDRLEGQIEGAKIADVFSGVGTMGMEAISRGAASCVFIEGDSDVHESLTQNVDLILEDQPTVCWKTNIHRTSFRPKNSEECLPYTLMFFDPPYVQCPLMNDGGVLGKALDRMAKPTVSTDDATIILRTPLRFDFLETPAWKIEDTWRISTMKIYTLRKAAFIEANPPEDTESSAALEDETDDR